MICERLCSEQQELIAVSRCSRMTEGRKQLDECIPCSHPIIRVLRFLIRIIRIIHCIIRTIRILFNKPPSTPSTPRTPPHLGAIIKTHIALHLDDKLLYMELVWLCLLLHSCCKLDKDCNIDKLKYRIVFRGYLCDPVILKTHGIRMHPFCC